MNCILFKHSITGISIFLHFGMVEGGNYTNAFVWEYLGWGFQSYPKRFDVGAGLCVSPALTHLILLIRILIEDHN